MSLDLKTTNYEVQAIGIPDTYLAGTACDTKEAAEAKAQEMIRDGAHEIHVYLNGEFYSMWQRPVVRSKA